MATTPANLVKVETPEHFQQELSKDLQRVSVSYYRADFAEPCKVMDGVIEELARRTPSVLFLTIEAEALPDISESFEVDAVPYFILLRGHTLLTRLSGAQPSILSAAIKSHSAKPSAQSTSSQTPQPARTVYQPSGEPVQGSAEAGGTVAGGGGFGDYDEEEESEEDLVKRCNDLMKQSDVVLFMKGDRDIPRCGFSQKIVGILNSEEIEYTTFDILGDEGVRQKLKEINEWPTFPQLIIKGEFCGGLDVIKEMQESGELQEMIKG